MPDLPALPLGAPQVRARITRSTPRPGLEGPGPARQTQRLGGELTRLTQAFDAQRLRVTADPGGFAAEQILVLEVAGELDEFVNAVRRVPGLEFLAEEAEEQLEPDDDFAAVDRKTGKRSRFTRQLFLIASDASAWTQLLGLWDTFQRGEQFPRGLTPFRDLFGRLRTLRAWDDRDRLERTGALRAWSHELTELRDELVEFEIELWLRRDQTLRRAVVDQLRIELEEAGGNLLAEHLQPEIGYHGLLGRVPAHRLLDAVHRHEVRWLTTGAVRFFHAAGQFATSPAEEDVTPNATPEFKPSASEPQGSPRIAVLDGVPLAGHAALRGRVIVDDPDGWEQTTPAARRIHGTGMASVVIHGDLNAAGTAHRLPIYMRPILAAQAPDWVPGSHPEELPRDRLAVDVLHGAIARLFEGEAVAPGIRTIVLAVGDRVQQFDGFVSPLARLLDWLAYRHSVLFIVSGGNQIDGFEISHDVNHKDTEELQHEMLVALVREAASRRLLAPGESANALTIGAAHGDHAPAQEPDDRVEPLLIGDLPNVVSPSGGGIRRSVKPDLLMPGGRQLVRLEPVTDDGLRRVTVPGTERPPGVLMASPGRQSGVLDATVYATGTSVATALAGHHAGHLLDQLDDLRRLYAESMPGGAFDSVLLKAALAHSARWGAAEALLNHACEELTGSRSRDTIARVLGYGYGDPSRALHCDDHRVTVLSAGRIADGQAHAYRFPLPPSLAAQTVRRRVTLTLAWLTPINVDHRSYRRAALKLEPNAPSQLIGDRTNVGHYASARGTLQHEIHEGKRAVPYASDSAIELVVSCRADAGALDSSVPYALIATLEVPAALGLPIYQEVRQRLRTQVRSSP